MPRGAAGQQGTGPAGFNRCEVPGFEARGGVPDAENTTMKGKQEPSCNPRLDLRLRHSGAQQLVTGYDAVRLRGQPSDLLLDGADLWSHIDH